MSNKEATPSTTITTVYHFVQTIKQLDFNLPIFVQTDSDDPESLYVPEVHLVQDTKGNYYVIK